jgi:hypothetical protein
VSMSNMRSNKQCALTNYEKVASVTNSDYSEKICLLETNSHFNSSSSKFSSQTQTFSHMPNKERNHNVKDITPSLFYL